VVEEVGVHVTDLKVGDKVAVKPNLSDGACWPCSVGRINCCNSLGFIGYSGECLKLEHCISLSQMSPQILIIIPPMTKKLTQISKGVLVVCPIILSWTGSMRYCYPNQSH
jgi:D-arabinose 1-dehydrogenase-like Zn-dependent alcohol dehydrogenase